MMRNLPLLIILLVYPITVISQEKLDIGGIFGVSYYLGDYNPSTQFKLSSPAAGFIIRNNINKLYSIRLSGSFGKVQGNHNQSDYYLPNLPANPKFSALLLEAEVVSEIGFIPFATKHENKHDFTPYVVLGIGGAYSSNNDSPILHLPIGIGVKYTPLNRWTIGAEWRIHKTFTDNIDGYITPRDQSQFSIHSYDWFGIAGFFVTFRLVKRGALCPAYK